MGTGVLRLWDAAAFRQRLADSALSARELARRLGVTHTAIRKWQRGTATPIVRRLGPLAAALNCSIADLLVGDASDSLAGLRALTGMNQRDLAARAGMSPSHLAAIEHSRYPPSETALQRIALAFGISDRDVLRRLPDAVSSRRRRRSGRGGRPPRPGPSA